MKSQSVCKYSTTGFLNSWMLHLLTSLVLCAVFTNRVVAQDRGPWHLLPVPDAFRSVPGGELTPVNGYSWYRALVKIPLDWSDGDVLLVAEALDDARSAWVNGKQVGATGTFPPQFRSGLGERGRYSVANDLLRPGEWNCIALRVYQSDPRPNFSVAPVVLLDQTTKTGIRLEGQWQYRPGDDASWGTAVPADFGIAADQLPADPEGTTRGLYQRIDQVEDVERYVSRRNGDTDPLSPAEAVKHFQTPDDLEVQLVLGDPEIAQPLFMMWDERGRLWVMEYRQYPDPAGLTMVSRDTFLRSVYDKVPPAPPNHFRGNDRITIHNDSDGDGVYDEHTTFVDGLNIATSFAIAHNGVYVTNPPYLLFYPDHDRNDIPDGDPEVLLEGFGIEDSHSVINSLRMGPDGWLYGAQGSTVSGVIRRPGSKEPPIRTLGQQIWRYHPETRQFEVFAEGGGNTFGCEIDSKGRVFSGHNGGDTRGFHYVQGGYYRKGFGKHGPLSNPYAFGFFENIKHHSVARFTHNFILYEEGTLPERFRGKLFGIEPLQGQVVLSDVQPYQSSFETKDIERVLKTDDPWFRPVDIKAGPDGCIYVADMYEQRIDHSSHYAGRIDRTSGRIYRLKSKEQPRPTVFDYSQWSSADLLEVLEHPSRWHRQTAQRILTDRRDQSITTELLNRIDTATGQTALEYLWALNSTHSLTDNEVLQLIRHEDPFVRAWTVRLVGDRLKASEIVGAAFTELAGREGYIEVRKQLASSAKRLPPEVALSILNELMSFNEDVVDIHQPLLIWWGLEAQIGRATAEQIIAKTLKDHSAWSRPMVQEAVLGRLMKRYASTGTREDLLNAAVLLRAAPDKGSADLLLKGFEEAYQGRSLAGIPDELANAIAATGGGSLALRLRQRQPEAVQQALRLVTDPNTKTEDRRQLVEIMGQTGLPEAPSILIDMAKTEDDPILLATVFVALQGFELPEAADTACIRMKELGGDVRLAAETLLTSRVSYAHRYVSEVASGQLPKDLVSEQALRRMLVHNDQQLRQQIESVWGEVAGASTAQMQAEASRIANILATGSGNPKQGKSLYMQNCGRCHLLFEEGGRIGPDLTPFARDNTERILNNIVNPNLEIREGFENFVVQTTDGRVLNGFLADKDNQVVILRGIDGQNIVLQQADIEEMKAIPQSVMPEGTLKTLSDQQLRDLFAYLRSSQPVNY